MTERPQPGANDFIAKWLGRAFIGLAIAVLMTLVADVVL